MPSFFADDDPPLLLLPPPSDDLLGTEDEAAASYDELPISSSSLLPFLASSGAVSDAMVGLYLLLIVSLCVSFSPRCLVSRCA